MTSNPSNGWRWLFPSIRVVCPFRQRLASSLITWGVPIAILGGIHYGIPRRLAEWPLYVAIVAVSTFIGALFIAGVEHGLSLVLGSRRGSD